MAAAGLSTDLSCSVCREIYTDPVTLPCGHSFCRDCIERTWDWQKSIEENLTCPECRHRYRNRPELRRNVTLSSIVTSFLPSAAEQDGPGIYCTYCWSPRVTACSTCLLCKVSLCYKHAGEHSKSAEHQLTTPTPSRRDRHCSKHPDLLLEYYCPQDGVCVCASCNRVGEHRGHSLEPLNSETAEKKKETLRKVVEKLSPEREETEGQIQRLQERRREVAEKAAGETETVTALFRDIREQLEALEKRLLRDISREEEKVSHQLHDLIQQLEIKKDELSRKIRHIEELCNMADPLTVLQEPESHGAELYGAEGGDRKRRKMEDIAVPAVGDLDVNLISETLLTGLAGVASEIKGRFFPGQEATDLILDINTAGNYLAVSEDRKTASFSPNSYLETHLRYKFPQALSSRSFPSGRHYWEVEGSESGKWSVGMAYPSIDNEWWKSQIGDNDKSWCIAMRKKRYSVRHDMKDTKLPHVPSCGRIRISLDYEAGRVSFYELSEPIRHLHTFTATFTEPLHAAIAVREYGGDDDDDNDDDNDDDDNDDADEDDFWVRIIS
ncbi:E3 ubiquitin-protein ligase TRIM7 [Xenopus laevis]|uniref:E3 ubiquitin-protein ligase TRIM7 n=2 Tax=Xenopus laevis TaxID=8355 RepID=A0A1L8F563_XENLA|nr:E3 ubiquitin-protein ligase TRIM7 [Xenopus laevis]OCT66717.1 hypothetical protein XELAEV_18042969mg [Xenopus laevis]